MLKLARLEAELPLLRQAARRQGAIQELEHIELARLSSVAAPSSLSLVEYVQLKVHRAMEKSSLSWSRRGGTSRWRRGSSIVEGRARDGPARGADGRTAPCVAPRMQRLSSPC